jgi:vanillate O-demethylase ferredoxin subunit
LNEPDSRGGSKQIHATFKAGDTVTISAPRNHFELNDTGDKVLLLAGGIGVTPLLSMAEVLAKGETPFEFHYCGRAPETMAFDARLKTAAFKDAVTLHYDSGPAEQRLDLDALFKSSGDGFQVYVCGPAGFIDWVLTSAADFGVPDDKVHTEYFMATNDPLNAEDNQSFEVVIASTGNSYVIPPDRSIVEVLEENGIEIIVSCQQGICGSCVTTILEGEPIHNDQVLTDEEKDEDHQFTPCCSRAASKTLVLDL